MGINKDIWDDIEAGLPAESLEDEMFELVSAYSDGECSPKERRLVEAYLGENEVGRTLLADLRMASGSIGYSSPQPPSWLNAAILQKTTRKQGFPWVGVALRYLVPTAAAAAGLAFYFNQPSALQLTNLGFTGSGSPVSVPQVKQPFVVGDSTVVAQGLAPKTQRERILRTISQPTLKSDGLSTPTVRLEKPTLITAPPPKTMKEDGGNPVVASPEVVISSKPAPVQPDPVSMVGDVEDSSGSEEKVSSNADDSIAKLRERLKQVNSGAIDLGGAVHIPKGSR